MTFFAPTHPAFRRFGAPGWALIAVLVALLMPTAAQAGSWATATDPSTQTMYANACPTYLRCFAVGAGGAIVTTTDGGSTWTAMTSGTTQALRGISCPTTSFCVAVGSSDVIDSFDGTSWTVSGSNPNPGATLYGVSCPSVGVCFAASSNGGVARLASGTWTNTLTSTTGVLDSIGCVATTTTCFAGGAGGTLTTTTTGLTWTASTSNTTQIINGISCPSSAMCVAVAGGGVITTWNGTSWTVLSPLPTTQKLSAVACNAVTSCFASANDGSVDVLTSSGWTNVNTATGVILNGMAISPDGLTGVASGNTGVLDVYKCVAGTSLIVTGAPTSVALATTAITGVNQTATKSVGLTVEDQTSGYAGWNLQLSTSQFTTGTRTLPATATSLSSVASVASADNCNLPTNSVTGPVALTSTASKVYNAASATGIGGTDLTANLSVAIPGNAYVGTYSSTWTFTVATGP